MSQLTLTLLQTELEWESPRDNRDRFDELLERVEQTDVIVLPEMFSTGFSMSSAELAETMEGPTINWMRAKAEQKSATVCGSVIIEEEGHYFNRFVWMPSDGDPTTYDKRHLFRMGTENEHYSAGRKKVIVEQNGFRICPMVCYDLRFPVWSRNDTGFHLLLYVANWPAPRRQHWKTLLRARAVENLCYVVGLNRVGRDGNDVDYAGDSAIVDFNGETLVDLQDQATSTTATMDLESLEQYREAFPAWRDRDQFKLDGRFADEP